MESKPNQARQGGGKKRKSKQQWNDKRDRKRAKKEQAKANMPKDGGGYESQVLDMESPLFDEYYTKQFPFVSAEEYKQFKAILKEKLPVTFRVNVNEIGHESLIRIFKDPQFIQQMAEETESSNVAEAVEQTQTKDNSENGSNLLSNSKSSNDYKTTTLEEIKHLKLDLKPYYPNEALFELSLPRQMLKKCPGLKLIHKMILSANDAGVLSRQEIVSMLPPLLIGIEWNHSVLDVCAAPGSKTAQLLEMIQNDYNRHLKSGSAEIRHEKRGFVVANDADHQRAYLLTHQLNRLNATSKSSKFCRVCNDIGLDTLVTNHNGQTFPTCPSFDRIICDVPCSSDAAIRKLPQKWSSWTQKDGMGLHPLQMQILQRSIELLKVGGKVSYSTCSLNPVENEAVVAAVLQAYPGCLELVEVKVPGFKFREGLQNWRVMCTNFKPKEILDGGFTKETHETFFTEYQTFADVKDGNPHKQLKETMFASNYSEDIRKQLIRCLRVFPHDQNTSGFFITILRKIKDLDAPSVCRHARKFKAPGSEEVKDTSIAPSDPSKSRVIQTKGKGRAFNFERCDPVDPDIEYIRAYYGLTEDFPLEQLVTQSDDMNKLYFVSKEINDFLVEANHPQDFNIINMGIPVFHRNQGKFANVECIFRVAAEGARILVPYMAKRIVTLRNIDTFKQFLFTRCIEVSQIQDKEIQTAIDDLSTGCFVLALKFDEQKVELADAMVMHKFKSAVNPMVSRDSMASFRLRYLTREEQKRCEEV